MNETTRRIELGCTGATNNFVDELTIIISIVHRAEGISNRRSGLKSI